MKPIGPLMREHRLIERMVGLLEDKLSHIADQDIESLPDFIETTVDFFRTYADRTHHGKEEDILFRYLAAKDMSPEHRKIMDELIAEHVIARRNVGDLLDAGLDYRQGRSDAIQDIITHTKELVALYPKHIEKEDKRFFYPILDYLSEEEQEHMLQDFWEFDRSMIHEKYQKVVDELEND